MLVDVIISQLLHFFPPKQYFPPPNESDVVTSYNL
jgi:hypothetical protein